MQYRHIHYWQYEPGIEEENVLEAALALSLEARHDKFLVEIASFIYKHIQAKYVIIGRLSEDKQYIYTLVFMKDGEILDNYAYPLGGTPCEIAIAQRFCFYPFDVAPSFPDDTALREFKIESYLGTQLLSEENEPIGLTILMDEEQIQKAAFAEHLIQILSPAIEEEIKMLRL
jgi:hypothetical protein